MINIDKSHLVGKGNHREVYRHPQKDNLCIKIIFDGSTESRQDLREKSYYKHLEKRSISWDMLPKYHGDIPTNLGVGSVFDLITDQDDSVSKTLEYYLSTEDITASYHDDLSRLLPQLKKYLLAQRIITKSLAPRNIVCKKNNTSLNRLYIVDNIGNLDPFPISNYINYFAQLKIERRWNRFENKLLKRYTQNTTLHKILHNS